jgi:hypothetical protein
MKFNPVNLLRGIVSVAEWQDLDVTVHSVELYSAPFNPSVFTAGLITDTSAGVMSVVLYPA